MNSSSDRSFEKSTENILGPNPFVGFRKEQLVKQAARAAGLAITRPAATLSALGHFGQQLGRIVQGDSDIQPDPKDKRFRDEAWMQNPVYRRWLQSYLAANHALDGWVDSHEELTDRQHEQMAFAAQLLKDAIAPSNFPLQPAALRELRQTRGRSALHGVRNFLHDVRHNGGMPSQTDRSVYKVGKDLAVTPGAVVLRTPLFELIQYQPKSRVRQIPVLMVPPQINKYYVFDLSPEKSLAKYLVEEGFQLFMISWFNPTPKQRAWGLAEYTQAIGDAMDAVCDITSSPKINLLGACAGGMTLSSFTALQRARGDDRFNSVTLLVSMIDQSQTDDNALGMFASPALLKAIKMKTAAKGVLDGREMAAAFAWMRPNDLVWNYWVNNVLLGRKPPAFDILHWNNDTTRLPAKLHGEFLDMFADNLLANKRLKVNGETVDLSRIDCDSFLVAGVTDHLTPWRACYQNTQLFGGNATFVLSNAGHIQALLNPPGNKKAEFWASDSTPPDPDAWKAQAEHHSGSWWPFWWTWLHERSGEWKNASRKLGNKNYRAGDAAPGRYIFG